MHIAWQIALAAGVGGLSSLLVNFATARLRAKLDFNLYAKKVTFERRLEAFRSLMEHIENTVKTQQQISPRSPLKEELNRQIHEFRLSLQQLISCVRMNQIFFSEQLVEKVGILFAKSYQLQNFFEEVLNADDRYGYYITKGDRHLDYIDENSNALRETYREIASEMKRFGIVLDITE